MSRFPSNYYYNHEKASFKIALFLYRTLLQLSTYIKGTQDHYGSA